MCSLISVAGEGFLRSGSLLSAQHKSSLTLFVQSAFADLRQILAYCQSLNVKDALYELSDGGAHLGCGQGMTAECELWVVVSWLSRPIHGRRERK
jgi:hypothetical protein